MLKKQTNMQMVKTSSNSNLGSGQRQIPHSFPCAQAPAGKGAEAQAENLLPSLWDRPVFFLLGLTFSGLQVKWSGGQSLQQDQVVCLLGTVLGVVMLRVRADAVGPTPRGFSKSKVH